MGGASERFGIKPGDWLCPRCGDLVFASKAACKICQTTRPDEHAARKPAGQGRFGRFESRPGDWDCPKCGDMVFASRDKCKNCHTPKPKPAIVGEPVIQTTFMQAFAAQTEQNYRGIGSSPY